MKKGKLLAIAGIAGVVAASVAMTAPAQADPNGAPTFRELAGMGSDTTQNVMNALSEVVTIGGVKQIGSYNATGTPTVSTKGTVACTNIARVDGSSAGRNALLADLQAGTGCLDFARSSSGRGTFTSTPSMTWVPFASDASSFAVRSDGGVGRNFTVAQLTSIYKCTVASIKPVLPQTGSGSRSSWLGVVGVTEVQIANGDYPCLVPVGTTVNGVAGTGRPYVQENNATALKTDEVMPFSVGLYNIQASGVIADVRGQAVLGRIAGVTPQVAADTFPVSRTLYNIIPTSKTGTAPWSTVFVGNGSLVCTNGATIAAQGFNTIANCGATGDAS